MQKYDIFEIIQGLCEIRLACGKLDQFSKKKKMKGETRNSTKMENHKSKTRQKKHQRTKCRISFEKVWKLHYVKHQLRPSAKNPCSYIRRRIGLVQVHRFQRIGPKSHCVHARRNGSACGTCVCACVQVRVGVVLLCFSKSWCVNTLSRRCENVEN